MSFFGTDLTYPYIYTFIIDWSFLSQKMTHLFTVKNFIILCINLHQASTPQSSSYSAGPLFGLKLSTSYITRKLSVLRAPGHDFVFLVFCTAIQNYTLYVCFKNELLDPKKIPTSCNFEIFDHDPQQYDFQNYISYMFFQSEHLDPKKEKSPTCSIFEIFDHDPQLDIKF